MSTNKSVQRRLLYVSVGGICKDVGFQGASKASLETLTELIQAYISELTRSCRKYSEHGHRTTPDLTDVKMALAEVGLSAHGLNLYSKGVKNQPLRNINASKQPPEHKTLKSGLPNVNQPGYIPNYFPSYPDVHSFIRTPTLREPVNQYEIVRERIATQKKATENSLVKFLSKTNPADVLIFEGMDTNTYPVANIVTCTQPYLKALLYQNPEESNLDALDEKSDEDDPSSSSQDESIKNEPSDNSQISSNITPTENPYCKPPKRIRLKK